MSAVTEADFEEEHEARLAAQATIAIQSARIDELILQGSILQAQNDRLKEVNQMLVEALNKVSEDLNWMHNSKRLLNPFVFDYVDEALAKAGEQT
jgi:hypothetical protein